MIAGHIGRAAITGIVVGITVDPIAGAAAALLTVAIPRPEWAGMVILASGAGLVVVEVFLDHPAHGIAWPMHFAVLHVPVTATIVAVCTRLAIASPDE